eukprot:TRINITY_DN3985_c0_g1_i1.p2 TRINITY_DN3985_c0_g1~~TRINITY_DN3985_c0_g1_i1.p2  ORF type:complete len:224 (-),score=55.64 TRINITY_DN3985_c0_g1_i1:13-684(-)
MGATTSMETESSSIVPPRTPVANQNPNDPRSPMYGSNRTPISHQTQRLEEQHDPRSPHLFRTPISLGSSLPSDFTSDAMETVESEVNDVIDEGSFMESVESEVKLESSPDWKSLDLIIPTYSSPKLSPSKETLLRPNKHASPLVFDTQNPDSYQGRVARSINPETPLKTKKLSRRRTIVLSKSPALSDENSVNNVKAMKKSGSMGSITKSPRKPFGTINSIVV